MITHMASSGHTQQTRTHSGNLLQQIGHMLRRYPSLPADSGRSSTSTHGHTRACASTHTPYVRTCTALKCTALKCLGTTFLLHDTTTQHESLTQAACHSCHSTSDRVPTVFTHISCCHTHQLDSNDSLLGLPEVLVERPQGSKLHDQLHGLTGNDTCDTGNVRRWTLPTKSWWD